MVSAPITSRRAATSPTACRSTSSATRGNGTPTLSSGTPMRPLPSAMNTVSAHAASTQPPAMACPFTAATIGFGSSNAALNISDSAGRKRATYGSPCSR